MIVQLWRSVVSLVLFFTFLGCASTQVITPDTSFTLSGEATLVTSTGMRISTRRVTTIGDTVTAQDYQYDRIHRFHFSEVQAVVTKDHQRGTLYGLGGGFAIGMIWGLADQDEQMPMVSVMIGGMFLGIGGTIIGAINGYTTTYLFENVQQDSVVKE